MRGDISWSMVDGRAPQADDEVVVGQTTLERRGVTLGATVQIASRSSPPLPYRLVGVVVFPSIEFSSPLDDGAGFTQAGGARLGLGDRSRDDAGSLVVLVRWAAGADQSQALERFAAEDFVARPPSPAPAINGLDDVKWFPAIAAVPLIVLGGIATTQAIAVTARRRRGDLGVLSVFGFTSGQRRAVIGVQATVIAIIALVVGIPLGVVAARLVWGAIAGSMGVAADIAIPVVTLIVGAVGFLVALNLVGAVPARIAGRMRVADELRAE